MKKICPIFMLIYLFGFGQKVENRFNQVENIDSLTTDFMKYWTYYYHNVDLSKDIYFLDTESNFIKKDVFLKNIIYKEYLPLKITVKDSIFYKLKEVSSTKKDILNTIKEEARQTLFNYNFEGTELPKYNFRTIDDKIITNDSTKGKILFIKLWFIGCQRCEEERPILNSIIEKNADKDIIFTSITWDNKEKLTNYVKKHDIKYSIIGENENYIKNLLKINSFPTYFLINNEGKIIKVASSINNFKDFFYY